MIFRSYSPPSVPPSLLFIIVEDAECSVMPYLFVVLIRKGTIIELIRK
jgi:hypothetical protein